MRRARAMGQEASLLHLEADGALDLVDLGLEVVVGVEGRGELAGLVESGAEQTGNLLDERGRGEEGVVGVGQLLDQLLVLVELLERVGVHGGDAQQLGVVDVAGVSEEAHLELGARDVGEQQRAGETLVTLGIVVLQGDLQVHRLGELALWDISQPEIGCLAGRPASPWRA